MVGSVLRVILSLVNVASSVISDEGVRRVVVVTLTALVLLLAPGKVVVTSEGDESDGQFCIKACLVE